MWIPAEIIIFLTILFLLLFFLIKTLRTVIICIGRDKRKHFRKTGSFFLFLHTRRYIWLHELALRCEDKTKLCSQGIYVDPIKVNEVTEALQTAVLISGLCTAANNPWKVTGLNELKTCQFSVIFAAIKLSINDNDLFGF